MKRYLVFVCTAYYPSGGWSDFETDFNDLDEAVKYAKTKQGPYDWTQIIDTETGTEVPSGEDQ